MRATLDRMWAQLREFFGKLSRRSKILLLILALAVIVLAIVAVSLFSRVTYATLHTAQDSAEAGRVFSALEEMGEKPHIEGNRVLVPENKIDELRGRLSSAGIIGPAEPNLDIMSMAASFNVTEAHARMLYQAQLAQDIRASILQTSKIQNCQVILSVGQTSAFARQSNVNQPYCSVMLKLNSGMTLSKQEAQTIADFVCKAVPGITYDNITITDSDLYTYRIGEANEDFDQVLESRNMLTNVLSRQYQEAGLQILTPIFGMRNIEISARVVLNFDKESIERTEYAPPIAGELDGLAISASDLWEAARRDGLEGGIPGTDTNAMGSIEYPYGTLEEGEVWERAIRERNYEINVTKTLIEKEEGDIESVNIAVTINALAVEEDYTDQVVDLIHRGMGVPLQNISVQRMPFIDSDDSLADMYDQWQKDIESERQKEFINLIIQWAVILLLGIAFFSMIGVLIKGSKPPPPEPVLTDGAYGGIDYITDEDYYDEIEPEIDDVELNKKSTGLEQIERFIDKDPAAVAQLLRNWLTDE